MNTNFDYNPDSSAWTWHLAILSDAADIVRLSQQFFQEEVAGIYQPDPEYYLYQIELAILRQLREPGHELVCVARMRHTGQLAAYSWCTRTTSMFSREQTAEARILHIRQDLSTRQRCAITVQTIKQWILWATVTNCEVLVSSTIRQEQDTFIRLHKRQGFTCRGSICYLKLPKTT